MWKSLALAAAAGLLGSLLVGGCSGSGPIAQPESPSVSVPQPGPTQVDSDQAASVQGQLERVAEQITRGRSDAEIPGFSGLSFDIEHRALDVYWVTEPPAEVQRIIDNPPPGVTIKAHRSAYDAATLMKAVEKLTAAYGDELSAVSVPPDGSGLQVEQTAESAASGPSKEQLSSAAGVPVFVEIGEPAEPANG